MSWYEKLFDIGKLFDINFTGEQEQEFVQILNENVSDTIDSNSILFERNFQFDRVGFRSNFQIWLLIGSDFDIYTFNLNLTPWVLWVQQLA